MSLPVINQLVMLALIPFSVLATLLLTRWAGLHKEKDYVFVFCMMVALVFLGSLIVLSSLSHPVTVVHITISVEPTTVTVGENVTISGSIQPRLAGVAVRIRWQPLERSWGTLATVTTDENGKFSYVWTPETVGTYEVRTEWLGSPTISYDISHIVVVTVVETKK